MFQKCSEYKNITHLHIIIINNNNDFIYLGEQHLRKTWKLGRKNERDNRWKYILTAAATVTSARVYCTSERRYFLLFTILLFMYTIILLLLLYT